MTDDPKFRDEALDWARSHERAEPWQSWTYSIEAALAPDPADRDRALAMLSYLDPGSRQLSSVAKSTIAEAAKRYGDTNVFKGRPPGGPKPNIT
jgi:hypothetical protein